MNKLYYYKHHNNFYIKTKKGIYYYQDWQFYSSDLHTKSLRQEILTYD